MAEVQKLKRFHVEPEGEGFLLRMEDETGGTFAVTATPEQLDLIADSLDDALDTNEAEDGIDEAEDEGKA